MANTGIAAWHMSADSSSGLQGSVAVFYNWLKIGGDPHTWVTDTISDYALGVSFVGLSTEDRKFIYPQKEVGKGLQDLLHLHVTMRICL